MALAGPLRHYGNHYKQVFDSCALAGEENIEQVFVMVVMVLLDIVGLTCVLVRVCVYARAYRGRWCSGPQPLQTGVRMLPKQVYV